MAGKTTSRSGSSCPEGEQERGRRRGVMAAGIRCWNAPQVDTAKS